MTDLKKQMEKNFLQYASYVILDRAIPDIVDGLKPVQRRILYTLHKMHNGKLHKVANVTGQTMAYHPHGDAPISDALVNLANKGYLLDKQGNFGNIYTGDPAAASRYIETRLSVLAEENLFNADLTETLPSYDGRHEEPVALPAKLPILLLQGAEGIAVGMSTRILPHNFQEVLQAEIALLEGKSYTLLPDFPTGGIMDATHYNAGCGKVRLRAKIKVQDDKTILIHEICFGTTTESLIRSIDEAAKKGRIKIESIHDFTAEKVEIEIKLPRGQHAPHFIEALYAFTECEVSLSTQFLVIKDQLPFETTVDGALQDHAERLQHYLKRELEIRRDFLQEKIFQKSLEQIFISNRLYKRIEEINSQEEIHATIAASLIPYHDQLHRIPTSDDRERLLNIPLRRITRFDLNLHREEISAATAESLFIEKELTQVKRVAINYLKGVLKKYGKLFPRKTEIQEIETIDKRAIATRKMRLFFDLQTGFIGTKIQAEHSLECTNYDKLLLLFKEGSYMVCPIPEKQFVNQNNLTLIYVGVADKKTPFTVIYKEKNNHLFYAKRFIISKFITDKLYSYLEENTELQSFTTKEDASLTLEFIKKPKQKSDFIVMALNEIPIKGVSAKGIRLSNKEVASLQINSH